VLTKATAAAALPALLYALWARSEGKGWIRWRAPLVALGTFALLAGGYQVWASHRFAADIAYFRHINVAERAARSAGEYLRSLRTTVLGFYHLEHFTAAPLPLLCLPAFARLRGLRANPLAATAALWLAGSVLLMGGITYHPTRYAVPLLVPAYLLLVCAADAVAGVGGGERALRLAPAAACALLALPNVLFTARHLAQPAYTFAAMAADVGRIVRAENCPPGTIPLMGGPAFSVALGSGVAAMNSDLGTAPLEWRVARYRPRFYITDGVDPQSAAVVLRYDAEPVASWNVYGNYYTGRPLTLYRLNYDGAGRKPAPSPDRTDSWRSR
jgi:hypothetical protein